MNRRRVIADVTLAALAVGVAPLLRRMRADFVRDGRLRGSTSTRSWLAHTAFATLLAEALTRRPAATRVVVPVRAAGAGLVAAGTALDVAAMRRFSSLAQLSGTDTGALVSGGVYRWSRNPPRRRTWSGASGARTAPTSARRTAGGALPRRADAARPRLSCRSRRRSPRRSGSCR